jgi:predicted transcriptional regulator
MNPQSLSRFIAQINRTPDQTSPMARQAGKLIQSKDYNGREISWLLLAAGSATLCHSGKQLHRLGVTRGLYLMKRGYQLKAKRSQSKLAYLHAKQQKLNLIATYALDSLYSKLQFGGKTTLTERQVMRLASKLERVKSRMARQVIKHSQFVLRAESCEQASNKSWRATEQDRLLNYYGQVEVAQNQTTRATPRPDASTPPKPAPRTKPMQAHKATPAPHPAGPVKPPRRIPAQVRTEPARTAQANPRGEPPPVPNKPLWLQARLQDEKKPNSQQE